MLKASLSFFFNRLVLIVVDCFYITAKGLIVLLTSPHTYYYCCIYNIIYYNRRSNEAVC